MKLYDIKVYSRFFPYTYDVSEEYEDLVFTIYRREFYNALRDLKDDVLELWYDEESGFLKLAPYGHTAGWRFVGERATERLPPYPALDFVNGAYIIGFLDYVDLRRYAKDMLVTFDWKDRWLNVRVGKEDGSVIIRIPDNRLSIYSYGADTWATYKLDHIVLPEVGEPHVKVEMAKGEQLPARFVAETWDYTYKLYVSPHFDVKVPEPPKYKEYASFHIDSPEPLWYLFEMVQERELYDNAFIPINFRSFEFLGLNLTGSTLVNAYFDPFIVMVQMIEPVLIVPYYVDLASRACELQGKVFMGIDKGNIVRLCDVYTGELVRPKHADMLNLLKKKYDEFSEAFEQYAKDYAYIKVFGENLAKAIGKAKRMSMTVYPDGRALVEIDGVKWKERDLLSVRPATKQVSVTLEVKDIPVLPTVRTLKGKIIKIGFYDSTKPVVFDYELEPFIRIVGYIRPL